MAYDKQLAERIRHIVGINPDVSERAMFGGLAFLVNGHMAVAATSRGDMMVRVDPTESENFASRTGVSPMVMRGRKMNGWLRVDVSFLDNRKLSEWIDRATAYSRALPPKG